MTFAGGMNHSAPPIDSSTVNSYQSRAGKGAGKGVILLFQKKYVAEQKSRMTPFPLSNLMAFLSQSVGLSAYTELIWGGVSFHNTFTHRDTFVSRITGGTDTMTVNPGAWTFKYHSVAIVGGVEQDAALNVTGVDATAICDGAVVGGEEVRILKKDTGALVELSDFDFASVALP